MRKPTVFLLLLFSLPVAAQSTLDDRWVAFDRAGSPVNDLQCFAPGNVTIFGGNLQITTRSQVSTCRSFDLKPAAYRYTSGFVIMRSFHFLYGSVEVRAKFGGGPHSGSWPAIWLADTSCQPSDPTGTDDRCNEQEIDIAEVLDGDFTRLNQQIHVGHFKHNDGCRPATADTSAGFHVFGLDWSPGFLAFKVDGTVTCTIRRSYVPDAPMYLKISVFTGRYGGPIENGSLPWKTLIDYVKIIQGTKVVFDDDFGGPSAGK